MLWSGQERLQLLGVMLRLACLQREGSGHIRGLFLSSPETFRAHSGVSRHETAVVLFFIPFALYEKTSFTGG